MNRYFYKLTRGACIGVVAVFVSALSASAQQWPRLRSPSSDPVCTASLELATLAFQSRTHILYEINTVPADIGLTLVIEPKGRDISGGHALVVDAEQFDEIPAAQGRRRSLYWQRHPQHGIAFVLSEQDFGWRGDWFELLAVPDKATPADVQSEIDAQLRPEKRTYPLLLENEWRPPLLVRDNKMGEVWAISVGPSNAWLSDWRIFSIGVDGAKERCGIQFYPDVAPPNIVGRAWDLLPEETRGLAQLIDGTLGAGENEGTANPTARIRIEAAHSWANAAMRPWVFAGADTAALREDNEARLADWSRRGKSFEQHYKKILRQLPVAEAALTDHYLRTFAMSEPEAASAARAAIDTSISANYGFFLPPQ